MSSHDLFNRIEIKGLFGRQDETIEFMGDDSRVRILYGLNGSGKTTILRLIEAAIRWKPIVLWQIEFDSITFERKNEGSAVIDEEDPNFEELYKRELLIIHEGKDPQSGASWRCYGLYQTITETYSIKRVRKVGNPTILEVTCDVSVVWSSDSMEQTELIASETPMNSEWHYEKEIESPDSYVINRGKLEEMLNAVHTLYGIECYKKEELEYSFVYDGSELTFHDILARFVPPEMFPDGYWSNRPDPTSRFLQLPIQSTSGELEIPSPRSWRVSVSTPDDDEMKKERGFNLKPDDIGDFEYDWAYSPNLYRNYQRPNYPVRFLRTDRLTSLMRGEESKVIAENTPTAVIDAAAIQRLTDEIMFYINELMNDIKNIEDNFSDFVKTIEDEREVDDKLEIGDGKEFERHKPEREKIEKKYGFEMPGTTNDSINTILSELSYSIDVVLDYWDDAGTIIREFGGLVDRLQSTGILPELRSDDDPVDAVSWDDARNSPPPRYVDIADHFPHSTLSSTPTMKIQEIATRMNWLERLTKAISLLNSKMAGKEIKLTSHGKGLSVQSDDGTTLTVHHLSSGEMQMLLIFTYLVDRIGRQHDIGGRGLPPLVLIDEPELSMHISWQRCFIDDLLDIFFNDAINNPQFIIATHSPSIVSTHMYRGYELGAQGVVENLEM